VSQLEIIKPTAHDTRFRKRCALGIMTKAPIAGKVKTRLSPPLTALEAAALNICFLRDLSSSIELAARRAAAVGVAVYTPVGSESVYDGILPPGFFLLPQRGEKFGARLLNAASDLLASGFSSVCLINSDSPTVPVSNFVEAATELAKSGDRVVLGPSDDGGYYLVGLKKLHQRVFEEIDWSTERVLEQTVARAREIGVSVHQLPHGFDVDDRETLQRLCDEILSDEGGDGIAKNTRKFLGDIIAREGRQRIWPV
jgi:rSAM/selenodomain-associated transferase 1